MYCRISRAILVSSLIGLSFDCCRFWIAWVRSMRFTSFSLKVMIWLRFWRAKFSSVLSKANSLARMVKMCSSSWQALSSAIRILVLRSSGLIWSSVNWFCCWFCCLGMGLIFGWLFFWNL